MFASWSSSTLQQIHFKDLKQLFGSPLNLPLDLPPFPPKQTTKKPWHEAPSPQKSLAKLPHINAPSNMEMSSFCLRVENGHPKFGDLMCYNRQKQSHVNLVYNQQIRKTATTTTNNRHATWIKLRYPHLETLPKATHGGFQGQRWVAAFTWNVCAKVHWFVDSFKAVAKSSYTMENIKSQMVRVRCEIWCNKNKQ